MSSSGDDNEEVVERQEKRLRKKRRRDGDDLVEAAELELFEQGIIGDEPTPLEELFHQERSSRLAGLFEAAGIPREEEELFRLPPLNPIIERIDDPSEYSEVQFVQPLHIPPEGSTPHPDEVSVMSPPSADQVRDRVQIPLFPVPPPIIRDEISPALHPESDSESLPLIGGGSSRKQKKKKKQKKEGKQDFRINAKRLVLTYPKCWATKEQCYQDLLAYFTVNLDWMFIVRENHKDGTPHLHVCICLKKKVNITTPTALDIIGILPPEAYLRSEMPIGPSLEVRNNQITAFNRGEKLWKYHGQYESMESEVGSIGYCMKFDENPVCHNIDPKKLLWHKSGKLDKAAILAYDGGFEALEEIRKQWPGLHMMQLTKLEAVAQKGERAKEGVPQKGWIYIPRRPDRGPETDQEPAYHWIPLGMQRDGRQAQVYIWGPAATGKTTLRMWIEAAGFRSFEIPANNDFSGWQDKYFCCMFIDEFDGTRTIRVQILNRLADGGSYKYNAKYDRAAVKRDNVTLFVYSNYDSLFVYEKKEAIRARKEKRDMTEAELNAVDEGIMGFIDRFKHININTLAYDLFKARFFKEDGITEIKVEQPDPGHYCTKCGKNVRVTQGNKLCEHKELRTINGKLEVTWKAVQPLPPFMRVNHSSREH